MPVSLQNLLKIGQLKEHPPDAAEVQRLLAAAARNLADARVMTISPETRFDAAYKAVMQAALAALMAHGYRPDTSRPGHHATVVQGLALTIALASARVTVLDTLRRKRIYPTTRARISMILRWSIALSRLTSCCRMSRHGSRPIDHN